MAEQLKFGIVAKQDNARAYLIPKNVEGVTYDSKTGLVTVADSTDIAKYKLSTLTNIPGVGGTSEKIDNTYLSDSAKKSVEGLADYGEIALSVGVTDTEAARLSTFKANNAEVYLCIAVRDNKKNQVFGLSVLTKVSDFKLEDISVNSLIAASVTLSIQGEISNEFLDPDKETVTEAYTAAITAAKAELATTEAGE